MNRWPIGCSCLLAAAAAAQEPPCNGLRLTDVAAESGVVFVHERGASPEKHLPETMGSGLAWLDFDGDGRLDLYAVQSGPFPPDGSAAARNRLYRNLGAGRFEEVEGGAGAGDRGYGQGVLAADLDGDGWTDLYVTNYGPDVFLHNRGDGSFEDRSEPAGLTLDGWSSSAAAADADADGDLDLYVTRYVEYDPQAAIFCGDPSNGERRYCDPTLFPGAYDVLFVNEGGGRFRRSGAIADADGKGLGVLFADLDDDGDPDLYVANDLTINLLYDNRGGLRFEQASLLSGAGLNADGKAEAGMGLALGDVDGDRDPDIIVSNFDVETNTLYLNQGGLAFEDRSAPTGFGPASFNLLGFGTALADFDLDGDLDAYVTNGHIFERPTRDHVGYEQPDLLLLGDGRGRFVAAACGDAFDGRFVGRGLAVADYDDDGDPDVAINNSGGPLQLLRNETPAADWAGLQLVGDSPNTEAIGARVSLLTAGGRREAWVLAGDSYQSTSDKRVRFAAVPPNAEFVVRWPDGSEQTVAAETGRYRALRRSGGQPDAPGSAGDARPAWLLPTLGLALLLAAGLILFLRRRNHAR